MESIVSYDGIQISTATAMGKELASWETRNRIPGYRPEAYPYPKMLYKAQKRHDGKVVCMDSAPTPWGWATPDQFEKEKERVDGFNRSCTLIVNSEAEAAAARSQGWCESAKLALEAHEKWEQAIGDAAAERAAQDAKMSERAQAEAKVVDDSTHEHVPFIPESRTLKIDKRTKAYKDSLKASA